MSVVTIGSTETVLLGIRDVPEPDYRLPGACFKCEEMTDANNEGLRFIGPWHIKCLDLLKNGW